MKDKDLKEWTKVKDTHTSTGPDYTDYVTGEEWRKYFPKLGIAIVEKSKRMSGGDVMNAHIRVYFQGQSNNELRFLYRDGELHSSELDIEELKNLVDRYAEKGFELSEKEEEILSTLVELSDSIDFDTKNPHYYLFDKKKFSKLNKELSFSLSKNILKKLSNVGLIYWNNRSKNIHITDWGFGFLKKYREK